MLNIYQYKFKIINQKFEIQFFTKNNIYIYIYVGKYFNRDEKTTFPCILAIHKDFFFLLQTKYNYHHIKLKNYMDINGFLNNYISDMTENH